MMSMYVRSGTFPWTRRSRDVCSRGLIGRCLRARMQVLDRYSGQEPGVFDQRVQGSMSFLYTGGEMGTRRVSGTSTVHACV